MIFNIAGGGGTALNFKVVHYATEDNLLAAMPVENTIGIVSDTQITSWLFSVEEPGLSEEGAVWFPIGVSSPIEFNALKKNGIKVYPKGAIQYADGVWADVLAYIYQNGAWVKFSDVITDLYLFDNGEQFIDVTGGWVLHNKASLTDVSICLRTWFENRGAQTSTTNKIDVTSFDTLHVYVDESHRNSYICLLPNPVVNDFNTNKNSSVVTETIIESGDEDVEYTVDVSSIEGSYYIWIGNPGSAGDYFDGCYVSKVWLTKEGSGTPSVPSTANVATFILNRNSNTPVLAEINGTSYGVENATLNQGPTETTYDFTVL